MTSPFATVGAKLVERGYSVVPIMPGSKSPGEISHGSWYPMRDWPRFALRLPTKYDLMIFNTWPDAGVGLVAGPASGDVVGVDIDVDDAAIVAAITAVVPASTVSKRGRKGRTLFYRAPTIEKSKSWNLTNAEGKSYRVCDLIGPGRQTLVPGTIHQDTGKPYVWLGPDSLENTAPAELPELLPEHIAAIDAALTPLGFVEETVKPTRCASSGCDDADKSIFRRLNDEALANLGAWVPALELARCRRTQNGYEAVAVWRASNSGQPIEKRKLNLKISPRGIVDFGDGPRGYTAIDLVMTALDVDRDRAFRVLADALGWNDFVISLQLSTAGIKQ